MDDLEMALKKNRKGGSTRKQERVEFIALNFKHKMFFLKYYVQAVADLEIWYGWAQAMSSVQKFELQA